MEIILHTFPTRDDSREVIEALYCELLTLRRNGEQLDTETLDWFDSANGWLISTEL